MRRALAGGFALALGLAVLFVPFRHRTLVSTPEGSFAFVEERVWAPLWAQPQVASGVAEYPFGWLLGVGSVLLFSALVSLVPLRRARARRTKGEP